MAMLENMETKYDVVVQLMDPTDVGEPLLRPRFYFLGIRSDVAKFSKAQAMDLVRNVWASVRGSLGSSSRLERPTFAKQSLGGGKDAGSSAKTMESSKGFLAFQVANQASANGHSGMTGGQKEPAKPGQKAHMLALQMTSFCIYLVSAMCGRN